MRRTIPTFFLILLIAALYYFSGKFGLSLAYIHKSASAVWPPTGISLALILLLGYQIWPGILIGAFLVNITTEGTVATSLGIATGNTFEALLSGFLILQYAKGWEVFDRPRNIFKFLVITGISAAISACFGVTSLSLGGFAEWNHYFGIWSTWWFGDTISALVIAPLIVIWFSKPIPRFTTRDKLEMVLLLLFLLAIGETTFGNLFPPRIERYVFEFLGVPIILYTILRFAQHGAVTIAFMSSAIAIRGTLLGYGPFVLENPNESLILLQVFIGALTLTALLLSAITLERNRGELALQRRESSDKFRSVTETAHDAIVLANSQGNIIYANKSAKRIFGYSSEQMVGKPLTLLMPERFHQPHREGLARFLATGQSRIMGRGLELEGQKADGSIFPLTLSLATWKTEGEIFFSGILQDLTITKKAEEFLKRRNTLMLLLQLVAVSANQVKTTEEAIRISLAAICTHLNWPIGHAYRISPEDHQFGPIHLWHTAAPDKFKIFQRTIEKSFFRKSPALGLRIIDIKQAT